MILLQDTLRLHSFAESQSTELHQLLLSVLSRALELAKCHAEISSTPSDPSMLHHHFAIEFTFTPQIFPSPPKFILAASPCPKARLSVPASSIPPTPDLSTRPLSSPAWRAGSRRRRADLGRRRLRLPDSGAEDAAGRRLLREGGGVGG